VLWQRSAVCYLVAPAALHIVTLSFWVQVLALWCMAQYNVPRELPERSWYFNRRKLEYGAEHKTGELRLVQSFRHDPPTMKSLGSKFLLDGIVGSHDINYLGPFRDLMTEIFVSFPQVLQIVCAGPVSALGECMQCQIPRPSTSTDIGVYVWT
jgi:hypothetical protein